MLNSSGGDIQEIILPIYDAAADSRLWPDVLQSLADRINAVGCIVFERSTGPEKRSLVATLASSYYDPAAIQTYVDRCFEWEARDQDIFEAHSLRADGIDLIQDDVIEPDIEALKARPNVATLQKLGILHRAAGLLNKDNTLISRFSVQLSTDRGRLTGDEHMQLAQVLPHVAKALDLGRIIRQTAQEYRGLLASMDTLGIGVCILDAAGRIVVENREFDRQLQDHGAFAPDPRGVLKFWAPDNQRRFERLKSHVLNHGRFGARPRKEAISADSDSILCIEMVPLERSDEIGSSRFGGFVLYSTDTNLPLVCNIPAMTQAYGLTEAEAGLVEAISEGMTNSQIADSRERSVNTINTHVKSILSKTNCATRTQLVRLMMSFGTARTPK